MEEPEQTVPPPPVSGRHRLPTPRHPRPSGGGEEDAPAEERASPFPYAEKFDDWVADETATSDGRQQRRDTGSRDAAP